MIKVNPELQGDIMPVVSRRHALAAGLAWSARAAERPRFVKGVTSSVFPAGTPYADCIDRAANAGFEAIEIRLDAKEFLPPSATAEDAERLAEIAASKNLRI